MQRNSFAGVPCPCGVDEEIANESKAIPADRTVSSRGCNRLFIVSVLLSALEHLKSATHGRMFPAPPEIVSAWLETAKTYCSAANDTTVYGGPAFNIHDPSTHWSEPQQLLTWWKNFVERRRKQESLLRDASYNGDDERRQQRARFCRHILHLCSLIRRRHQELQQMPEDGPQHQPHLMASDAMMASQNGMPHAVHGMHHRPQMHSSSVATSHPAGPSIAMSSQSQPNGTAMRYAQFQQGGGYATAAMPTPKQSIPSRITTMAHMLPQQGLPLAIRMPQPRPQQQVQQQPQPQQQAPTFSMRPPSPRRQTPEPAISSATAPEVNVQHSSQQHQRHASSQQTCCSNCHTPSSPMTTLFDSITSAYDPPTVPGPDSEVGAATESATTQLPQRGKSSSITMLSRSKSADFNRQMADQHSSSCSRPSVKPSYDFPVRKRRRGHSGSSSAGSGSASEASPDSAAGKSTPATHADATTLSLPTVKAAITRICTSKDDLMDRFDILLQEFQKAVQVKQAQTDLLKRYLQCSGEANKPAKRPRFPALGTYDIGSRYTNVQEMLDVALADSHLPPSGHDRNACSAALCILCGNSVQALWTFFCSQGPETFERALVLRAGYTIPEAQAMVRHFEELAASQSNVVATVTPEQEEDQEEEGQKEQDAPGQL